MPLVAFVTLGDGAEDAALVAALRARGAYIVALLPRDRWDEALDVHSVGYDDVLLTPCPPRSFGVRALLACEAARVAQPSPWHRPRFVLAEALARGVDGEVIVRAPAASARILVSRGRVAWVHDDQGHEQLIDRLRALGVSLTSDELAQVIAESQNTSEHFAEILARWGLAERKTVEAAVLALVDSRLGAVLARPHSTAMFIPARSNGGAKLGFTTEELRSSHGTLPPPSFVRSRGSLFDEDTRALGETVAQTVLAIDGCIAASVLDYDLANLIAFAGSGADASLAFTLASALHALEDPAADIFACASERCHVARRLPGERARFVYAAFNLSSTSIALARRSLADTVTRMTKERMRNGNQAVARTDSQD